VSTAALLEKLSGQHITLWLEGDKLRYRGPKEVLTPELLAQLKASKVEILETLSEEVVLSSVDVLSIAREVLPPLKEAGRVGLQELLQANQPPEPGRDPLTKHDTDKAHFFQASADCGCDVCMPLPRYATIRDGRAYRGGQA
jgi:hypothetical protein